MPLHRPRVVEEPFVPGGAFASVAVAVDVDTDVAAERAVDIAAWPADLHPDDLHPDDLHPDDLHPDEHALALAMPAMRRAGFVAGRLALRAALRACAPHAADQPLLRTVRGGPQLPSGVTGSISHKRTRAIALAAPSIDTRTDARTDTRTDARVHAREYVGVDLEERPTARDLERPSIARRILTAYEQDVLAPLEPLAHREQTLLHFALKEAVYKAIDPLVHRYVQFTEVELDVAADGTAAVRLLLPEPIVRDLAVTAHWRFDGAFLIAMARSRTP